MAQYKVIQDIEAEDKLVGPLTLRQFIYAGVAVVCLYICFLAYTKDAAFLIAFFLPIAVAAGFFGFPWKGEQPTEIWALARARFMLKPRVRIWDQDGVKNLVTVIAPKKTAMYRSPKADMSQNEVRSRLKALADTIDSRGWATRNAAYGGINNQQWVHPTVAANANGSNPLAAMIPNDDMFDEQNSVAQNFDAMLHKSQSQQRERVMQQMSQAQNPAQPQQPVPMTPLQTAVPQYSYAMPQLPTPVGVDPTMAQMPAAPVVTPTMPQAAQPTQAYGAMPTLPVPSMTGPVTDDISPSQPEYWFANGPAYPMNPTVVEPGGQYHIESDMPIATAATPTAEEASLVENIKREKQSAMAINYGHMRVLQPTTDPYGGAGSNNVPIDYQGSQPMGTPVYSDTPTTSSPPPPPAQPVTHTPDPAILELANNDDLDIATIARQAKREIDKSPDEVEIRLH